MYRILIVEDDLGIAQAMQNQIQTWNLEAKCVENFRDVMKEFAAYDPQLVLLDISLPFYNGYYWCTEIRKVSKVPILFISSASDNMNIVMAMNMGGDDFIAKPFDLNVLMAKIQATLRRTYDFGGQVSILQHRGAILNISDATLTYEGQRIELTKNDYRLLRTLMENKGKVVSRDMLMQKLWEMDSFVDENALTVNIARLRKKLENAGLTDFIGTKKGLGYIIERTEKIDETVFGISEISYKKYRNVSGIFRDIHRGISSIPSAARRCFLRGGPVSVSGSAYRYP